MWQLVTNMNKYLIITFLFILCGCSTSRNNLKLIGVSNVTKQQYLIAPKKYKTIETSYGDSSRANQGALNEYGNIFYKIMFESTIDLNEKQANVVGVVPEIWECGSGRKFGWGYIYTISRKRYFTFLPAQQFYGIDKHDFINNPQDLHKQFRTTKRPSTKINRLSNS